MNRDAQILSSHEKLLSRAKHLRAIDDYEGALKIINLLLAENSANTAAQVVKASLLELLGRLDEAMPIYEDVGKMELTPDFAFDYLSHIALIKRDNGDLGGAILSLKKALEYSPNNWDALYTLGLLYFKIRDWVSAIREIQSGLRLHPKPEGYSIMGCTYHAMGERQLAIQSFRKALELEHDYDEAHFNLGRALFENQDYEAARFHLNFAISQDPSWRAKLPPHQLAFLESGTVKDQ